MFTPRPSSSRPSSSRPQRGGAPASARSHAVLGADPSSPAAPPSRLHFTCPAPPLAAQQLPASAGSPVPHPSFFPPPVAAGSSAALAAPPDSFSAPLFAAQLFSPEASGADGQFTDLPTIRSAAQTAARGRNQGQDVCAEDALRRPSLYARPAQGAGALQSFGAFDCGSDEFRSRRTTRRNVGHRNAGLLVKDEFHAVSLLGQLPREVSNVFKTAEGETKLRGNSAADRKRNQPSMKRFKVPLACSELYAKIDVAVGYAMLVTRSNCFVWPYQKVCRSFVPGFKLLALPAVSYTFEAPPSAVDDANADDSLPLADFVSSDGQREPGLLIVSQTGECRYWELVSLAVSGTERCLTMQIHLGTEDQRGPRLLHAEVRLNRELPKKAHSALHHEFIL
ncbi:MAG: hypothetical protein BJ554DRAFT_2808 [Olpidium bornovanus]|uniref:Nucleoporin Nup133/Nup155-like N-terminal domain-containing protein n=1 Tax=Olpidium bornovanus TaxID=278681 RepID=A0A8H7ZQ86_9FUNG|nr:MAG: hypothetical protein BJ554DRAFT_2808 [Olpidium bornovanus]